MEKILIIDANNLFVRNFVMNPTTSPNGDHMGGTLGFLRSLQKIACTINPTKIIVVWDSFAGSKKRKDIFKEYKNNRILKLNRILPSSSEEQVLKNKIEQILSLIDILNELPVIQMMFDGVEADDVISHICQHSLYDQDLKIILSSDQDFYQLLSERVVAYNAIKKCYISAQNVKNDFGISPTNFALAKAICGDKSDNIPGIQGVGFRTVAKYFPIMIEDSYKTFSDIANLCWDLKNKNIAQKILSHKELVKKNYSIMQLYFPLISPQVSMNINQILQDFREDFEEENFKKILSENFISDYMFVGLINFFNDFVSGR